MAMTRAQRLLATQRTYEEWSEKTPFVTDYEASDQNEDALIALQLKADPQLNQSANN